jgi:TP901 family phage tail tape measure protein
MSLEDIIQKMNEITKSAEEARLGMDNITISEDTEESINRINAKLTEMRKILTEAYREKTGIGEALLIRKSITGGKKGTELEQLEASQEITSLYQAEKAISTTIKAVEADVRMLSKTLDSLKTKLSKTTETASIRDATEAAQTFKRPEPDLSDLAGERRPKIMTTSTGFSFKHPEEYMQEWLAKKLELAPLQMKLYRKNLPDEERQEVKDSVTRIQAELDDILEKRRQANLAIRSEKGELPDVSEEISELGKKAQKLGTSLLDLDKDIQEARSAIKKIKTLLKSPDLTEEGRASLQGSLEYAQGILEYNKEAKAALEQDLQVERKNWYKAEESKRLVSKPRTQLGPKTGEYIDKYIKEEKDLYSTNIQKEIIDSIKSGVVSLPISKNRSQNIAFREMVKEILESYGFKMTGASINRNNEINPTDTPILSASVSKINADLETMSIKELNDELEKLLTLQEKDKSEVAPQDRVRSRRIEDLETEIKIKERMARMDETLLAIEKKRWAEAKISDINAADLPTTEEGLKTELSSVYSAREEAALSGKTKTVEALDNRLNRINSALNKFDAKIETKLEATAKVIETKTSEIVAKPIDVSNVDIKASPLELTQELIDRKAEELEVARRDPKRSKEDIKALEDALNKITEEFYATLDSTTKAVGKANKTVKKAKEKVEKSEKEIAEDTLREATPPATPPPKEPPATTGTIPPEEPPDNKDLLIQQLKAELLKASRGKPPTRIDEVTEELLSGKELTPRMRMGGGSYLTRSIENIDKIRSIIEKINSLDKVELDTTPPESLLHTFRPGYAEEQRTSNLRAAGGKTDLRSFQEVRKLSVEAQKDLETTISLTKEQEKEYESQGKTLGYVLNKAENGWYQVSRAIIDNEKNITRVKTAYTDLSKVVSQEDYEEVIKPEAQRKEFISKRGYKTDLAELVGSKKLPAENYEELDKLVGISKEAEEAYRNLGKTSAYTLENLQDGWKKVSRVVVDSNNQVEIAAEAFYRQRGGTSEVTNFAGYQAALRPTLEKALPDFTKALNPDQLKKANLILNETDGIMKGLGQEVEKVVYDLKTFNEQWLLLQRTVSTGQGKNVSKAFIDTVNGNVFSDKEFKEELKRRQLAPMQEAGWRQLQTEDQFQGIFQIAQQRGWQQENLQKITEQQPSKVWLVDFERINEQTGATEKLSLATNQFGDILTRTNRRMLTFTEAVTRNFQELLRWSIGIGILYGGMRRVNEMLRIAIDNEAKLADITITLGQAQRDINDIFEDAAKVAEATGESINAVLETYALAYRAVGGIADPIERTTAANKLLTDATILNKLSSLDAAESIDVLAGSLRQMSETNETASQSFDKSRDLLDKWVKLSTRANVDLTTLATGFSVTAESALNAGMTMEELNAVLATLAEKIGGLGGKETGNAVRALIGGIYQEQAATALSRYGIAVTDTMGKMRDFMDISKDIYMLYKQGIITKDQLNDLGYILGGGVRRGQQYVAFLTDLERVEENVAVQGDAAGMSQEALGRKMDTVQTAITKLGNSFQQLAMTLGTKGGVLDSSKALLATFTFLVDIVNKLADTLGTLAIPAALTAVIGAYTKWGGTPAMRKIDAAGMGIGNFVGGMVGGAAGWFGKKDPARRSDILQNAGFYLPRGYNQAEELTGIGKTVSTWVSKYALGTLIGSAPALGRAGQGNFGGAAVDAAGAFVGSVVGSFAGPQGSLIGGIIGGAIADAFVNIATDDPAKNEFAAMFASAKQLSTEEDKTLTARETQRKKEEEAVSEGYKKVGFGVEWLGRVAVGVAAWQRNLFTPKEEDLSSQQQLLEALREDPLLKNTEAVKELVKYINQLNTTMERVLPEKETRFYQLTESFKPETTAATIQMGKWREDLLSQFRNKEITGKDYREGVQKSYDIPSALPRYLAAANYNAELFNSTLEEVKLTSKDFTDILSMGLDEDRLVMDQVISVIEDMGKALESTQLDEVEYRGEEIDRAKGQEILNDAIKEYKYLLTGAIQGVRDYKAEISQKHLAPMVDMSGLTKSREDALKAFEEAKAMERDEWTKQLEQGQITKEDWQNLVNKADATETFLYLGRDIAGALVKGLMDSGKIQDAWNTLAEQGAVAMQNVGYQFFDESISQIQGIINSPEYKAIRSGIIREGGKSEEGYSVAVSKIDPTDPRLMKADWAIVQYLLGRILDTEEKQLEGVYNLPGGASFYVPFDAYKMGYANQGAGAGLDIPTVQDNTVSTQENTRAINMLIQELGNLDITFSPSLTPEQAKALLEDPTRIKPSGVKLYGDNMTFNPEQSMAERIKTISDIIRDQNKWLKYTPPPAYSSNKEEMEKYSFNKSAEEGRNTFRQLRDIERNFDYNDFYNNMLDSVRKNQQMPPGVGYDPGRVFGPGTQLLPQYKSSDEDRFSNIESILSTISSNTSSMVDLLRASMANKQPWTGLGKDNPQSNQMAGASPQVNVSIAATPVKINLTTTSNLIVDGRVLASVILPYIYQQMLRFEPVAGGSSRRYTYV